MSDTALTAITNVRSKQTFVILNGRPVGRVHTLIDSTAPVALYRAESYRQPGFWCGRSIWGGDGPDGYFLDPVEAIAAVVADSFEWMSDIPVSEGLCRTDAYQRAERALIRGFVLTARITREGRPCFSVRRSSDWGCYSLPLLDHYAETFADARRLAASAGAALLVAGIDYIGDDCGILARWADRHRLSRSILC